MSNDPTHLTHEPIRVTVPEEVVDLDSLSRRDDIAPPNIWQKAVGVTHKASGRKAAVHRLDLMTRQFRAYYPDTQTFGDRTEWHSFNDWNVDVTFSVGELERQGAATRLTEELELLDTKELRLFEAFCADDDPRKALGKLEAMRETGMIRAKPDVPVAAPDNSSSKGPKK